MPGYGIVGPDAGRGLLAWEWATGRLASSHDYWVATVGPDGAPHVTPVWAVWADERLWLSCSNDSRKARNLRLEPRCSVTTDNPLQPVVVEGTAEFVTEPAAIADFAASVNAKYESDYGTEFFAGNACIAVRPEWVFALDSADFTGTPTRWRP